MAIFSLEHSYLEIRKGIRKVTYDLHEKNVSFNFGEHEKFL